MYTFDKKYTAHNYSRTAVVTIPDQVAVDQKKFDGCAFPVIRADGKKARAVLMGDEYGLWEPGTGDPVVKMV